MCTGVLWSCSVVHQRVGRLVYGGGLTQSIVHRPGGSVLWSHRIGVSYMAPSVAPSVSMNPTIGLEGQWPYSYAGMVWFGMVWYAML